MTKSELTNKEDVSAIYLYVYTEDLTSEQVSGMMSVQGIKLPSKISVKHKWNWCSKWHYGNNVLPTLENFINKDLPAFKAPLTELAEKYHATFDLHLVIGVGNGGSEGMHNNLELPWPIMQTFAKWKFNLIIYEDTQIGGDAK